MAAQSCGTDTTSFKVFVIVGNIPETDDGTQPHSIYGSFYSNQKSFNVCRGIAESFWGTVAQFFIAQDRDDKFE